MPREPRKKVKAPPPPLTDAQITELEAIWEKEAIHDRKGPWEACLKVVEHVRKNRW